VGYMVVAPRAGVGIIRAYAAARAASASADTQGVHHPIHAGRAREPVSGLQRRGAWYRIALLKLPLPGPHWVKHT